MDIYDPAIGYWSKKCIDHVHIFSNPQGHTIKLDVAGIVFGLRKVFQIVVEFFREED
jgi:hypothetical protein